MPDVPTILPVASYQNKVHPSRTDTGRKPIIEVEQLIKRYKGAERNAVDGASFTVNGGELFALLGPNGAGKTTTISILTTTLAPTSGRAVIAGHDVGAEASVVRQNVGIIFQKPSLDMNLMAEENVRFHAILYGLYPFRPSYSLMPRGYKAQVTELASILGITEDIFKPIKTFSGGMKRKLEIIRSLIHRPRVLFLDEPTVGLDPSSRRSLWEYLHKVRSESGTTIFLTTHYLEEAEQSDTICTIQHGKVVAQGTPAQLKAEMTGEFILVDAEDREQLRRELESLRLPHSEGTYVRIELDGRSAHQVFKAIETPLTRIETRTATLEDVYLEIVSKS